MERNSKLEIKYTERRQRKEVEREGDKKYERDSEINIKAVLKR